MQISRKCNPDLLPLMLHPGYLVPLALAGPDALPLHRPLRAFFGALTSDNGLSCHLTDTTSRLSTAPGIARPRLVAGPMGHGSLRYLIPANTKRRAPSLRLQCVGAGSVG